MSKFADLPNNIYQQIPRHADLHVLKIKLNIRKIEDIIISILREYCNVNIMGFNSIQNFYWCKIEKNKKCMLYTEIRLYANDYDSSCIIVINDDDTNLKYKGLKTTFKKTFIDNLTEGVYLYQNSSFLTPLFETCCA
jgi:hypothetical protein